jgi:hypothetical protein
VAALGALTDTIRRAGYLVVDPGCSGELPPEVNELFHRPIGYDQLRLYARKAAAGN